MTDKVNAAVKATITYLCPTPGCPSVTERGFYVCTVKRDIPLAGPWPTEREARATCAARRSIE